MLYTSFNFFQPGHLRVSCWHFTVLSQVFGISVSNFCSLFVIFVYAKLPDGNWKPLTVEKSLTFL